MRLAWFSPMPPVPSGIAACSAELVAALGVRHEIDVYVDDAQLGCGAGFDSAHEFVWRHRRRPYDLTVYQVGNSSHHDYLWPYLFRYPGLTVLHDAHLHHARAATLLRTGRTEHYRAEFAANQPEASADLAELAVAGFDSHLYYSWPMTRLVVEASRLTAVHAGLIADQLRRDVPGGAVAAIRLAHGEPVDADQIRRARAAVRGRHGIGDEAIVFGLFGGLTPDKRVPQILDAMAAIAPSVPQAHLLLAGAAVRHFDVAAGVRDRGLGDRVTLAGYLDRDSDLTDCIAASDVSLNLRWPTAREMSGPWLRALAAGTPTVILDLAHLADVPSLDPRTWQRRRGAAAPSARSAEPHRHFPVGTPDPQVPVPDEPAVCVALDVLDEDHSLRLAMRRLAGDPGLRASIGAAGRAYWEREHSMPRMLEDYDRVLAQAAAAPAPRAVLPAHLVTDGDRRLTSILDGWPVGAGGERANPTTPGTTERDQGKKGCGKL